MAGWGALVAERPDIAGPGRDILYQFGVGLAFLGTVRADGGPRVHAMCPVLVDERLCALLIPSPKRRDLLRDPRFALHTFPRPDDENALYLTGSARPADDPGLASAVVAQFLAERAHLDVPAERVAHDQPFELVPDMAMLTLTSGHGDFQPRHLVWRAAPASAP